jgi:ABC-2 type transport system permease protein
MNNLAFKALTLTVLIPVWLVLCLLFQPDFSAVTPQSVLLAIPAIMLGFGISFLMGAAITCVAFWTTRVYSLTEFYYGMTVLFAGQFIPLELMPGPIRQVAQYLPFQLLKYFPIQVILGRLTTESIVRNYILGMLWFFGALALFLFIWRRGIKQFSAVGA